MLTKWTTAPSAVKWTTLLWFVFGVAGIGSAVYSLITFLSIPVWEMTVLVLLEVGIQATIALVVLVAAWKFLAHVGWGRTVLEVATWLTLIYYAGGALLWVGSALFNWEEFKTSVAAEGPPIAPEVKLLAGVAVTVILVTLSAFVLRALRSISSRNYVARQR